LGGGVTYKTKTRACIDCGDPCGEKRCAACASVACNGSPRTVTRNPKRQHSIPMLAAECWCQRTTVWVRVEDLHRGMTGSCGEANCRREA
jgi:hypothetical protein